MNNQTKPLVKRIGGEVIALLVLIPLLIVLSLVLIRFNNASVPQPSGMPTPTPLHETVGEATVSPQPITTQTSTPSTQSVTLTVTDNKLATKTYNVAITQNSSVIDVMRVAEAQGLTMETKDYGGSLGLFIQSINGLSNDPATGRYWNVYINNQHSPLGASNVTVKAGDAVRWSLEKESTNN